jgi:integrase/recombinase XerD
MRLEPFSKRSCTCRISHRKPLYYTNAASKHSLGALDSIEVVKERVVELRERGSSPVTVNTYLRHIKCFYLWKGLEWKLPWLKEEQKILSTFTPEHIKALVHWKPVKRSDTRLHALTLTALDTGMRVQELLSLTRSDVDFQNFTLRVKGKGIKYRVVPMSVELRKVLYRYLAKHNFTLVFSSLHGRQLSKRNLLRDFKEVCAMLGIAGVRCSFHTLRHSFAVGYLRRGGNP